MSPINLLEAVTASVHCYLKLLLLLLACSLVSLIQLNVCQAWFFSVAQDFKVHIYHGRSEGAWVRDWLRGILEVRRFEVTASSLTSPCGSDIKKIIIVATEKMLKKGYDPTSLRSADGKLVLIIKLSECSIPEDIEDICTAHLDLSTLGTHDQTLQTPLMFKVYKALKLPMSICSA